MSGTKMLAWELGRQLREMQTQKKELQDKVCVVLEIGF